MNDPTLQSGPESVGAETRPDELKPCVVGDSPESVSRRTSTQQAKRRALVEAASIALPVQEAEAQAFGGRTAWNTRVRPARAEARVKAIRTLVRCAERALENSTGLEIADVVAALRSLLLRPADLLVCGISGEWLSTPQAVRHRGEELAGALVELAWIIRRAAEVNHA